MKVTKYLDQEGLIELLKDLLCAPKTYKYNTTSGVYQLNTKANMYEVQRAIFEWLSVPERKHNFILMGGKK